MLLAIALAVLSPRAQEIGETVVTAPRSEAPATDTGADHVVATAEELAATGERSLPRQIGKATGVWIQETNLGGGSPLIQGLSGNQVLLLIDGVRMNDSTTRNGVNQMLNGVDPATVERVEVIRGPRSVLYGTDALGGVVLVWTKTRKPPADDSDKEVHGALEGRGQTAAEGWVGSVELSGGFSNLGMLAVASYHDWHGLHSADGEVDNTGYEGGALFGSFETQIDPLRTLRLTSSISKDHDVPRTDRLNPGFGQTEPANSEFEFSIQNRQRVVLAYGDRSGFLSDELEARLSYRFYEEEREIRSFGSTTRREEQDTTNTVGIGVDLKKGIGNGHLLTYGIDADYDDVDSKRLDVDITTGVGTPNDGAFAPRSRFFSGGAFAQYEVTTWEHWDATLGGRWNYFSFGFQDLTTGEDEDGSFDAFSGSLAVGRDLGEDLKLVGTVARGFRAPNLAELARDATFFGGEELHNADLDPEESLYGELALDVKKKAWNGSVAVFHNNISDVVGSTLLDAGGPQTGDEIYLRENIGTLEIYGAFLSALTRLGGPQSPWSGRTVVEYTFGQQYSDFVDPNTNTRPFNDEPGQRIPPLHGLVGLRYDVGPGWFGWVELLTNWAAEQDRLSPQDLADPRIDPGGTDGWVTVDLDFGGPLGEWGYDSRWYLGVHNIFNEDYRIHGSGVDGPGVGLVIGARFSR